MAIKKPIVLYDGVLQYIQDGDFVDNVDDSIALRASSEVDVVSGAVSVAKSIAVIAEDGASAARSIGIQNESIADVPLQQVVTVAKSGGDYTTIQAAIDSITDAATDKRYVVQVAPGIYNEAVTLKDFVDLHGIGAWARQTIIEYDTNTPLTFTGSDRSDVVNIEVHSTASASSIPVVLITGGTHFMYQCVLVGTFDDCYNDMVSITDGTLHFNTGAMSYTMTGETIGGNTHRLVHVEGSAYIRIANAELAMSVADETDTVIGIDENNTATNRTYFVDSELSVTCTHPTFSGIAAAYYANGTTLDKCLRNLSITLTSEGTGGTGYIFYIDTTSNNGVLYSQSGNYAVTGFGSNYENYIGTGDTVVCHFNRINAADGDSGPGNQVYIHATADGELAVSGNLTVAATTTINKILDEDNFASNDSEALATQQSIKAYVDSCADVKSEATSEARSVATDANSHAAAAMSEAYVASEYTNTNWDVTTVKDALDDSLEYIENTYGSGRMTPETVLSGFGTATLGVASGNGYISYQGFHRYISWSGDSIDVSGYAEGKWWVYIDTTGTIQTNLTEPDRSTNILLGFFYFGGSIIGVIQQCGCMIKSAMNAAMTFALRLGPFIYDGGGLVQVLSSSEATKIVSPACKVQYAHLAFDEEELDSDDAGTAFFNFYASADDGWEQNYYFLSPLGYDGEIPTDIYNDTTGDATIATTANCTFTNLSATVESDSDLTSEIAVGDLIHLTADTAVYMTPVTAIDYNVTTPSKTTITLNSLYGGTGGTGATNINKALQPIPSGKWVKHLIARSTGNKLYLVLGQAYYDTEDDANNAGSPTLPTSIVGANINMAYIVFQEGETDLDGLIQDIRPLPFSLREGGAQGAGTVTDHGDLSGLADDDHTQYVLANGSRDFTAVQQYSTHPTFTTPLDIPDVKYTSEASSVAFSIGARAESIANLALSVADSEALSIAVKANSDAEILSDAVLVTDSNVEVTHSIAVKAELDASDAQSHASIAQSYGAVNSETASVADSRAVVAKSTATAGVSFATINSESASHAESHASVAHSVAVRGESIGIVADSIAVRGESVAQLAQSEALVVSVYSNTNWGITTVKGALDDLTEYNEEFMGSGRITPASPLSGVFTSTLVVAGGSGYISYDTYHRKITWSGDSIDVSGYAEGLWYVYVDTNGDIQTTDTEPSTRTNIKLGFFYFGGTVIGVIQQGTTYMASALNGLADTTKRLGPWIYDGGGLLQVQSGGNNLKVVSTACKAQYGLFSTDLAEIDSDDAGTLYFNYYNSADDGWEINYYFLSALGYDGETPTDMWNDKTKNATTNATANCTFTNLNNIVTSASDLTSEIAVGDLIHLLADGATYATPVSAIDYNVTTPSTTTITLKSLYGGAGGTGGTNINKALPAIPSNKWVKHLVLRSMDGHMFILLGQAVYDTEDDAVAAGIPEIPSAIETANLKLAYIIVQEGETDLDGCIRDIRPLPFSLREGGAQGGAAATDHGNLSGLADDDHLQYLRTNGSRDVTGVMKYTTPQTFTNEGELIDYKYGSEAISTAKSHADYVESLAHDNTASIIDTNSIADKAESLGVLAEGRASEATSVGVSGESYGRYGISIGRSAESQGTLDNSIADRAQSLGRQGVNRASQATSIGEYAKSFGIVGDSVADRAESLAKLVPIARGGTGQTAKTDAFDALAPTTTKGDLIVHNGSDNIRVAVGANNLALLADSAQASGVKWGSVAAGALNYAEDNDAALAQTTSTTFVDIPNISITPAAGTYLVLCSIDTYTSSKNDYGEFAIYYGGTQNANSVRRQQWDATSKRHIPSIIGVVTVNGAQAITLRYRSGGGATISVVNKTMVIAKIG